jgi:hypothetical protein
MRCKLVVEWHSSIRFAQAGLEETDTLARPLDVVDAGNRLAASPMGHNASPSLGSIVIGQENPARRVGQNYSLLGCHATMIFETRGELGSPDT